MRGRAAAFAREFARLGYAAPRILAIFHDPFYAEAYVTVAALGEAAVQAIIAEAIAAEVPLGRRTGEARR